VTFKGSTILENWINIFLDDRYVGTITQKDFKTNFRYDNLNFIE
jgi:hypothetical protein